MRGGEVNKAVNIPIKRAQSLDRCWFKTHMLQSTMHISLLYLLEVEEKLILRNITVFCVMICQISGVFFT